MTHRSIAHWLMSGAWLLACADARCATLLTNVLDARGRAVPDVVVVATAMRAPVPSSGAGAAAVMDQVDKTFVPHILAIRTGTAVTFPNSDSVAHQVYSFSPARRFELGLYRGHPHPPIVFDRAGVVVVGCNIHDNMVGYIYVTDSPWFGKSDASGHLQLQDLPAGEYRVTIWSPRLAHDESATSQTVQLTGDEREQIGFRLARALLPGPAQRDPRVRDY